MAIADGLEVASVEPELAFEVEGVNDRVQLAALEREFQNFQAKQLMQQGVHLIDPTRFDLRGNFTVGQDVRIDINVIIEGDCELGDGVEIGAGCIIKNTQIAAGTKVQPYSVFDQAVVGEDAQIGPFCTFTSGCVNWPMKCILVTLLKLKIVTIGFGSKANHFTYLGDAEIGAVRILERERLLVIMMVRINLKPIIGDQCFYWFKQFIGCTCKDWQWCNGRRRLNDYP